MLPLRDSFAESSRGSTSAPSPTLPMTDINRRYLSGARFTRLPLIRTPLSSTQSSSPMSDVSSRRGMSSFQRATARLPRAVSRSLVIVSLICVVIFLFRMAEGGPEEGVWDASSYSDRRGSSPDGGGGFGVWKKRIKEWNAPQVTSPVLPAPCFGAKSRPNLSRQNWTLPRPTHSGISRTPVPGAPDKYTTGPLPTLDEAWEYLHPRLKDIKNRVSAIPREHELWNPIFNPSLTDEHKERFGHLRMNWDEDNEVWVPAEKRWLFVTVCRQVAGGSNRTWQPRWI